MMCVFLAFITNPSPFVKMIGLGLATAIAIDATVVRMVLVPATMALMGRANWWLPRWLDRLLPHISLETDVSVAPARPVPATVAVSLPHQSDGHRSPQEEDAGAARR
jgi:RND superfamily putative drug exporter